MLNRLAQKSKCDVFYPIIFLILCNKSAFDAYQWYEADTHY